MSHSFQQPGGWTFHLHDIDQLSRLFGAWHGRFDQISTGRFEADLRLVRGGSVQAFAIQANQRVRIRGGDTSGLVMINPLSAGSAGSLWQGRSLEERQLVLMNADNETDYTSPRLTAHQAVSLRPDELDDAIQVLNNEDRQGLPRGWAAISPPPDCFTRMDRLLSRFVQVGTSMPEQLRTPEGRQLEQELVRAVVTAIATKDVPRIALSMPARHRLVLGAEELMRSQLTDPLGAVDLCRRLRVSDRTLRLAFRERYGLGPMGYYKCLRLNAVRAALKADRHQTVAEAAEAFGFHHLGNFAADYRRLFGEKPSDTVR